MLINANPGDADDARDWERIDYMRTFHPDNGYYFLVAAGTTYDGVTYDRDTWVKRESSAGWTPTNLAEKILKIAQLPKFSGYAAGVFQNCSSITELKVCREWDVSALTNLNAFFRGCVNLRDLDVCKWDTSSVTMMNGTFRDCRLLRELNLSEWDTSNVTSLSYLFYGCRGLQTVADISTWDVEQSAGFLMTFCECSSMTSLNLSGWITSSATTMNSMFGSMDNLETLDIRNFDTGVVTNIANMFIYCYRLSYIHLGAAFFKTTLTIPFNGASRTLGMNADGSDNGWLAHLASVAPAITDGQSRTIQLPTKLKNATWAASYLTILTNKGYTIA